MLVRYIVTILLLIFSYLVAVSGVKLGSVYGIIGSTASTSVCSILPGLLYLKAPIENKPLLWRFLAILSVVFGCVVFLTTFSYFFTIGS
ncbi:hypothetical protein EDEG_02410 [Edhazardia aedis USNM 41457]|uniref:Amino acid transporter transmembrane domain-containing protein n=1 Tax=Edhazardia aedis (strain USNM 41457) TaxID=1003232 RepID=J9DPH0_EDHAE|nr:hypothetical protein EDEG_02410 [Edhazardia aedis USNM 41457]|eukprot:EJW03242.1 hypothetical protein EDEG_02410 [Edhazardia aedis USNM 41457]